MKSAYIFRRDLRLNDNTALLAALEQSDTVYCFFCLDPRQVGKNEYKSDNAIEFMFNSLTELADDLKKNGGKLHIFHGRPTELPLDKFDAVYVNRDYTPFSVQRDKELQAACEKAGATFHSFHDYLLTNPGDVMTGGGTPYTVYTPFMRRARTVPVRKVVENTHTNYGSMKVGGPLPKIHSNPHLFRKGGRTEALSILSELNNHKKYYDERNFPSIMGTTGLSAHNKFGTVSIREVYWAMKKTVGLDNGLVNELYWRDFYTHVAYHYPHVFGSAFRKKYNDVKWSHDKKLFKLWCEGKTGFPIVDAGMRQLNETGWMHNRVRMIVASFLTKTLHIDWQWGEKYFAQKLVDYDPCVNNGGWQWAASTGTDAQPYFRIFNPWRQQEKFDADCAYIKRWVPELSGYTRKEIHKGEATEQIVDHDVERKITLEMFK